MSSFQWIYSWQLLRDLQASTVQGYLFNDEGKYVGCARTLFIWVFQLWQLPLHCRSCATPTPLSSQFPIASTGTWHSCQSCAISDAAGAASACPAIFPIPLFLLTTPLLTISAYLLPLPQSSVNTSLFAVHSAFCPIFLFSTWFIRVSLQLIVHALLWYFLLGLTSFKSCFSLFCLSLSLSYRCKEGYHGLRCDQFVPKTDAILSDPSTLTFRFL